MRALIIYASRFGHNRIIARSLANELASYGATVFCDLARFCVADDIIGVDLLVLGTYTRAGHANRYLCELCDAISPRQLRRVRVALFGTDLTSQRLKGVPDGIDDLAARLHGRGCELDVPPLRIGLGRLEALVPGLGIGPAEQARIREFARQLIAADVSEAVF